MAAWAAAVAASASSAALQPDGSRFSLKIKYTFDYVRTVVHELWQASGVSAHRTVTLLCPRTPEPTVPGGS